MKEEREKTIRRMATIVFLGKCIADFSAGEEEKEAYHNAAISMLEALAEEAQSKKPFDAFYDEAAEIGWKMLQRYEYGAWRESE